MSTKSCAEFQADLPLHLYGELSLEEDEAIEEHVATCGACQQQMQALQSMLACLDDHREEVPVGDLAAARTRLFASITEHPATAWYERWLPDFSAPSFWIRQATAAGLVAVGFGLAQLPGLKLASNAPSVAGFETGDPVATRVRYVEPGQDGRIRLVVEDVRQRILTGHATDEPLHNLLVATCRNGDDPGVRSATMELLKGSAGSDDVREAFMAALRDGNPAVRAKAIEGLRPVLSEPDAQRAMLGVVLRDGDSGVRALAIDSLSSQPQAEFAGVLQQVLREERNTDVRQRCVRTLRAMNASLEIY